MTDTGQVPGEGLPENAGAQPEGQQPAAPAPGTYTFAGPDDGVGGPPAEEEDLLMPGAQGAWGEPQQVAAQQAPQQAQPQPQQQYAPEQYVQEQQYAQGVPFAQDPAQAAAQQAQDQYEAQLQAQQAQAAQAQQQGQPEQGQYLSPEDQQAHYQAQAQADAYARTTGQTTGQQPAPAQGSGHFPGPHEADGRDSGSLDYSAVRTPHSGTPAPGASATPPSGTNVPRRPLHLGPPVPEQSGAVRPLSDRGPSRPAPNPAAPPQPSQARHAGPPTVGPEYLDVAHQGPDSLPGPQLGELPPQNDAWTSQGQQAATAETVDQVPETEQPGQQGQPVQAEPSEPAPEAVLGTPPEPAAEAPVASASVAAPADPAGAMPVEQLEQAGQPGQSAPMPAAVPEDGAATGGNGAVDADGSGAAASGLIPAQQQAEAPVAEPLPAPVPVAEEQQRQSVAAEEAAPASGEDGAVAEQAGQPEQAGNDEEQQRQPHVDEHQNQNPAPGQAEAQTAAPAQPEPQDQPQPQPQPMPQPEAAGQPGQQAVDQGQVPAQGQAPEQEQLAAAPEAAPAAGETAGETVDAPVPSPEEATAASPAENGSGALISEDGSAAAAAPSTDGTPGNGAESAAPETGEAAEGAEAAVENTEPEQRTGSEEAAPEAPGVPEGAEAADVAEAPGTAEAPAVPEAPEPAEPEPSAEAETETEPAEPATPGGTADAVAQPVAAPEQPEQPEQSAPEQDTVEAGAAGDEAAAEPTENAEPAEDGAEPSTGEDEDADETTETEAAATEPAGPDAEPSAQPAEQPAEPQAESVGEPAPGYADAEREAVHRLMRERRDIRNGFRSDPIPHEVLLRVLEAAHTAPSVGHSQPWDFVVIRSEETRRTMHELAQRQREAYAKSLPKARAKQFKELKIEAILDTPVNIVITADPTRGGRHTLGRHTQPQMAPYSSALAVENLWLAARAEGLGVGWVSFFDEREMVRALELPEHLDVVAYLCVGYVDEFPPEPELAQAGWSKRRPLSWVVHEESYGRRVLPGSEPHDLLAETVAAIRPLDAKALGEAWERQKRMTKPSGALGMLEIISAQLCGLSRQCPPPIPEPAAVAVFAGDHGVHAQGVTPWPQEVTAQMVANFLGGGAVCNAFANQVGAEVCVIDVGVAGELPATPGLLPRKVRPGTADMTAGPALTREEVTQAIEVGIETARDLVTAGNKALLTGEMGIANTTSSAALISACTGADPAEVTGRGTGINDETHARKVEVVRRALELHKPDPADPIGLLAAVGGLEHAALVGLILGGASLRTPVILDGVSAGAAALVARALAPESLAACVAGHRSAEPGHVAALTKLGLRPLVDLDLRLGEGTGALLALPMVQSAARAMHEVATFDSAGVTEKN
ncbi:nicotinate-nucleotide--dimethylbenzimidazole phosphoribosyltransferase [Streptomyces sp. NPDC054796]